MNNTWIVKYYGTLFYRHHTILKLVIDPIRNVKVQRLVVFVGCSSEVSTGTNFFFCCCCCFRHHSGMVSLYITNFGCSEKFVRFLTLRVSSNVLTGGHRVMVECYSYGLLLDTLRSAHREHLDAILLLVRVRRRLFRYICSIIRSQDIAVFDSLSWRWHNNLDWSRPCRW